MQLPTTNSNTNEKITSDDIDGFEIVTQMITEKSATPATETETLASEPRRSNKDGAPDTISTFPFIHTIYFVIIADFLPPIVEAAMNLRIGSTELENNDDPARTHHYGYNRHHTHFYGPRGFMGPSPGFMPPHPAIFHRGPPGLTFEGFFPPRFAFGCGLGKHHKHGKHGGKFAKHINGAGHKHRHHRAYSPPSFEEFKGESGLDSHTKYMKDFFGPRGRHDHRHHRHASDDDVAAHQPIEKQVSTPESDSTSPSASDSETDSAATVSDGEGKYAEFYATHSFGMRRGLPFGGRGRGKAHHRGMKGMGHGKGLYMGPVGMDMRGIPGMGFDREHPPPPPPFFPEFGMGSRHCPRGFGGRGGRGGKHGCSFVPMGGMGPDAFFGRGKGPKHMPMHGRHHCSPPPAPQFMSNEQGPHAPFLPHPSRFGRHHGYHGRRGFGGHFAESNYEMRGTSASAASLAPAAALA